MKTALFLAAVAALVIFGGGCATIINGTRETLTINSTPTGARVIAGCFEGVTPATFELKRNRTYNVLITKDGYEPQSLVIKRTMNPWLLGNILLGGPIGIVIDLVDGAGFSLAPDGIVVNLVRTEAQAEPPPQKDDSHPPVLERTSK